MSLSNISDGLGLIASFANISDIDFHLADVFPSATRWKINPLALLDLTCLRLTLG